MRESFLAVCRLLGDAASGRTPDLEALPEEEALLAFVDAHRIGTLVSTALRQSGDTRFSSLHAAADRAAFHQFKNDLLTAKIPETLQQHGIRALPLKGVAIAAVYPDGWIRQASDADFFVPPAQLPSAVSVLKAEGFVVASEADGETALHKPPRTAVELHTTLGGHTDRQQKALARLSEREFTLTEHYVYTLFHLYKHFLRGGAGVKMFLDLYFLARAELDRAAADAWLDEAGLAAFDRAVQTVCGILFDGNDASDAMGEVVDVVLFGGAFGTVTLHNAMKYTTRPLTNARRFRMFLTDYRFDKASMQERYPVLKTNGWLYPVCAGHRVVRGILFKRRVLTHDVKQKHAADRRTIARVLKTMHIV